MYEHEQNLRHLQLETLRYLLREVSTVKPYFHPCIPSLSFYNIILVRLLNFRLLISTAIDLILGRLSDTRFEAWQTYFGLLKLGKYCISLCLLGYRISQSGLIFPQFLSQLVYRNLPSKRPL